MGLGVLVGCGLPPPPLGSGVKVAVAVGVLVGVGVGVLVGRGGTVAATVITFMLFSSRKRQAIAATQPLLPSSRTTLYHSPAELSFAMTPNLSPSYK